MEKQKILVAVLCGCERHCWLNPDLTFSLIQMARDTRFDVDFLKLADLRPWEFARNRGVAVARDGQYDWCVMLDNDICPFTNPLDILASAPANADVIGVRYGIPSEGTNGAEFFPPATATRAIFEEIDAVPGGVLVIRNSVWRTIPRGPWFKWDTDENSELLEPHNGEDVTFCRLVRERGLHVYLHADLAGHLRTRDITALAMKCVRRAA